MDRTQRPPLPSLMSWAPGKCGIQSNVQCLLALYEGSVSLLSALPWRKDHPDTPGKLRPAPRGPLRPETPHCARESASPPRRLSAAVAAGEELARVQ